MNPLRVLAVSVPLCAALHAQINNFPLRSEGMQLIENAVCVRAADFDGDGIQDVAVLRDGSIDHVEIGVRGATGLLPVVSPGSYAMVLGSPAARKGGGNGSVEGIMVVGQVAGSALPDVLVATNSGFLYLFENLGTPTVRSGWASNLLSALGLMTNIHDLALQDINQDGLLDLVVLWASTTTAPNQVRIFYNNGPSSASGPFTAANASSIPLWVGTGQGSPTCMAFHDANRDGAPETILCAIDGGTAGTRCIGWQINRSGLAAAPTFTGLPWILPLNATAPYHAVLADFDNDGIDDLALGCYTTSTTRGSILVQRLVLGAQVQPSGSVQSFHNNYVRSMAAADLDLDGDADLVAVTTNSYPVSDLVAFESLGSAGFAGTAVLVPTNQASALAEMATIYSVTTMELTIPADGKRDLAVAGDLATPSNRRGLRLLENANQYPWEAFGAGCAGSNGMLTLSRVTHAVRGSSYTVRLSGLPSPTALHGISFGLSNTVSASFGLLPAPLGTLGAPGCLVNTSTNSMVFQQVSNGGTATITTSVPANPILLGVVFYNQGFASDPAANSLGVTTSNGCRVRIL